MRVTVEYQVQEEQFIEVKSPIDRLRDQWTAESGAPFLRQFKLIQQNPELIQYVELARLPGWSQPLMFALKGLLLAAVLLCGLNWLITKDKGKQADDIAVVKADLDVEMKRLEGVIDASKFEISRVILSSKKEGFTVGDSGPRLNKHEALQRLNDLIEKTKASQQEYTHRAALQEKELHAIGDAHTLAYSGTPVIFTLALIFAAQLFRRSIYADYSWYKLTKQADSFYLYCLVSRGLWFNLGIVALLNLVLSGVAYGLGHLFEAAGPVGAAIFWLAVYALLLYYFYIVSLHVYKTMQIPVPRNAMSLDNKVLLRIHNSFWMVFVAFEAALLGLAYLSYLVAAKA